MSPHRVRPLQQPERRDQLAPHLQMARAAIQVAYRSTERPGRDDLIVQGLSAIGTPDRLQIRPTWTYAISDTTRHDPHAETMLATLAGASDILIAATPRHDLDDARRIAAPLREHLAGQIHIHVSDDATGRDLAAPETPFQLNLADTAALPSSAARLPIDSPPLSVIARIPGAGLDREAVADACMLVADWRTRAGTSEKVDLEALGLWRQALAGRDKWDAADLAVLLAGLDNPLTNHAAMLATLPASGHTPEAMLARAATPGEVRGLHHAAITGRIPSPTGPRHSRAISMASQLARLAPPGLKAPACAVGGYLSHLAGHRTQASAWLSWALADNPANELAASIFSHAAGAPPADPAATSPPAIAPSAPRL